MTTETLTKRLVARYERATPEQRDRGRAWYGLMHAKCVRLAAEHGTSSMRVAFILAGTSPRCTVEENLRRTERALRGEPVKGFAYMDALAQLPTSQLVTSVNGPKVRPFALAILGNHSSLVLDSWAVKATGIDADIPGPHRKALEAAYRRAAKRCGESVRDFQAITWIQVRETHIDKRGRKVRRKDVHEL